MSDDKQQATALVGSNFRELDSARTVETISRLGQRIDERFPDSGLSRLCKELLDIADDTREKCEWISRPHWGIRAGVAGLVALVIAGIVVGATLIAPGQTKPMGLWEFTQILEASMNDLLLIGAAAVFLVTTETRIKRNRALAALNELRAIAHVIDMHQLTKDPAALMPGDDTASSPRRTMDSYEINRYLDYCSEMLALAGKVAALYGQHLPDPVVLSTVTELESLTVGLSAKIWQKISLLDRADRSSNP